MKFSIKNWIIVLRSPIKVYAKPTLYTIGLTNRTPDNYFVLFLDYDDVEFQVVEEDVRFLQVNFDLGPALIRSAEEEKMDSGALVGSYHVFFFTKHKFDEIREMLKFVRCDPHFKRGFKYQQRAWVLRITNKRLLKNNKIEYIPYKFKMILTSPTSKPVYEGLVRFFEKFDDIELLKLFPKKLLDGSKEVEIIEYVTR